MSKSLPKAVAQGVFLTPLREKSFANTQVRLAQKLTQQNTPADGTPTDKLKAMQLLKRRLISGAGTPTVSHAVARKVFAAEQMTEQTLADAHKAHFLKSVYRNPHLTAAQVERRALKSFVSQQRPADNKDEMLKKTAKAYQAQRAEEAGDSSLLIGTGRERLQKMQTERERGEYASKVLKSAETGEAVEEKSNQNKFQNSPSVIPFAKNPNP